MSPDQKATGPCFATRRSGRVVTVLRMNAASFEWPRLLFARALVLLTGSCSEFRPLDSMEPTLFHLSHRRTEETLFD